MIYLFYQEDNIKYGNPSVMVGFYKI